LFTQARRPKVERLLVTGIDSVAGGNLALALADRCSIMGLYEETALESAAIPTARWRNGDSQTLAAHLEEWQPQWLIHCGPLAAASWDEPSLMTAAHDEAAAMRQMAALAQQWHCALTVIASDAVFCGPRMFHDESSPGYDGSPRAERQRAMEFALEATPALVIRTHLYGVSFGCNQQGFAEQAHATLTAGRNLETDCRRYATPILATDLAELLWRAYELRLSGLYHLAGAERTSGHRFVTELAASLGVTSTGAPHDDAHAEAVCHQETSLNSRRARRALAASTPMLREGIDRFVAQAQNGWGNAWRWVEEERPLADMAA
jgi:dTDP-4-dehydrorhamnose reductase